MEYCNNCGSKLTNIEYSNDNCSTYICINSRCTSFGYAQVRGIWNEALQQQAEGRFNRKTSKE